MNARNLTFAPLVLALAACSSEAPEGAPDAGPAPSADAGPADAGPLADRYLVAPKGLFGDGALTNRFLNPDFDLTAEGWLAYPILDGATARPEIQRRFVVDTPTRQPMLVAPKGAENPFGVGVIGTARAGAGMFEVRVWVGRPTDQADLAVDVSLAGVHPSEGERAWPLAPVDGSRTVQADRAWTQYAAVVEEGPAGFASLIAFDETETPFYLTGPELLPLAAQRRRGPVAAPRPLARLQRVALTRWADHQRALTAPRRARPVAPYRVR